MDKNLFSLSDTAFQLSLDSLSSSLSSLSLPLSPSSLKFTSHLTIRLINFFGFNLSTNLELSQCKPILRFHHKTIIGICNYQSSSIITNILNSLSALNLFTQCKLILLAICKAISLSPDFKLLLSTKNILPSWLSSIHISNISLPRGSKLFLPSPLFANNLLSFPLDTLKSLNSNNLKSYLLNSSQDPLELINSQTPLNLPFFTNVNDALSTLTNPTNTLQSNCQGKCINVYTLKKSASFSPPNPTLCTKFAGYHTGNTVFFCNPTHYLQRDYNDPNDWQFNPPIPENNYNLKQLVDVMKKYTSINVNFHSGNLYEHSVWSLLWCESIINSIPKFKSKFPLPPDSSYSIISFTAFIHDIGKAIYPRTHPQGDLYKINNTNFNPIFNPYFNHKSSSFFYDLILDHENIGYNMINSDALGYNGPKLSDLLRELQLPHSQNSLNLIKFLILKHRSFGDSVLKNITSPESIRPLLIQYSLSLKPNFHLIYGNSPLTQTPLTQPFHIPTSLLLYIIIIGTSDILASCPYGIDRLSFPNNSGNVKSTTIPQISNISSIYIGNRSNKWAHPSVILPKFYSCIQHLI